MVRVARCRADLWAMFGLGALWLAAIAIIGPGGDFPLSDDWAYGDSTFGWAETGQIERVRWTWAPILTHIWVGGSFVRLFGQSFESLRASTLVMGWLGVLGCYWLARALRARPGWAALAAVTVALNPLYLNLSFTFMTDVPFAALVTWSLACLVLGAPRLRAGWLAAGLSLATLATLSRQPGLAIPLGLAGAMAVRSRRRAIASAIAGLVGAAVLIPLAMRAGNIAGFNFDYFFERMIRDPNLPYFIASNLVVSVCYLGALLLPLLLATATVRDWRHLSVGAVAAAVLGSAMIIRLDRPIPPGINIIWDFGLGARTLHGSEHLPSAGPAFWWALTVIGLAAGGALIAWLGRQFWERRSELNARSDWLLLLLFAGIYLAVLAIRFPFFDRYLIPTLPALSALVVSLAPATTVRASGIARATSAATLAALAVYAVAGTRDYMEHHRARNIVLTEVVSLGATPKTLDGGFEYQGFHNYSSDRSGFLLNQRVWVNDDAFIVSHATTIPGYTEVARHGHWRWLPPGRHEIRGFRRDPVEGKKETW